MPRARRASAQILKWTRDQGTIPTPSKQQVRNDLLRSIFLDLKRIGRSTFGTVNFPRLSDIHIPEEAIWFFKRHAHLYAIARGKQGALSPYCAKYHEWLHALCNTLPPQVMQRLTKNARDESGSTADRPWASPYSEYSRWRRLWAHPDELTPDLRLVLDQYFSDPRNR